jgi:TolB protein
MRVTSFSLPPLPLNRRDVLIGGAAAGLLLPSLARAQTKLQITEGNVAPLPIAIPDFVAGSPADGEVGVGVAQVITNNLRRSGLFAPIDPAAFIEKVVNIDAAPQFQSWKTINAQALVTGRMTRQSDGRLKAEFRLWDVAAGQQLTGSNISPRRNTGAGSRISFPTRSMSA